MRFENRHRIPPRIELYALKTLNVIEAKKHAVESEFSTITYDSFLESVKSLSGFFKIYSILLILILIAILAPSFI